MKMEKIVRLLTGVCLSLFVISFCLTNRNVMIYYFIKKSDKGMMTLINVITWVLILIAVFLIVRYYVARKTNTLAAYYRQSIVVSLSGALLFFFLCTSLFFKLFIEGREEEYQNSRNFIVDSNGGFLLLLVMFFAFFLFFQLCTRRKVRYIRMMSEKVKEIEREGFGNTIEVIGEDELAELCKSINHMSLELLQKEGLEKENERKRKELITNVSHDLRSPLTSIIGYVDLLKQENISRDEYKRYIDVVDRRLHGLNILIGELFELTKLDSAEQILECTETDMDLFLSHMTEEYAIFFSEKGISLKTELLLEHQMIQIDPGKMTRALRNLLDNAGKYSADGTISFQAWVNTTERNLSIRISNPIGNTETISLDSVFDRFYKGDIARSDGNSSGLGLAITKRIIELHGGNISAEITEKEDEIFSVVIKIPYL